MGAERLDEYLEVTMVEQSETRRLAVVRSQGEVVGDLWYEAVPPIVRPFSGATMDFAAIAMLPYAMSQRKGLRIAGPVTRSLLMNLEEFQDVWANWVPDRFGRVDVFAETILDEDSPPVQGVPKKSSRGDILAFSGGLDSAYSLIAHQTGALGMRSKPIATLAMVHGFDIPLQDEEAFAVASVKAARIGKAFGAPLQRVRTNWRAWSPQWLMTFGMGLSSVLQQFSGDHNAAIMSADVPYRKNVSYISDNPITNRFMSCDGFPLLTVGFGALRTEKAQVVGRYRLARKLLRVCWAGEDLGRNCGHCEKCVRTKLNFLAAGIGTIPALGSLDPGEIETLTTQTPGQLRLLDDILSAQPGLPTQYQAALAAVVEREHVKHPAAF